MEDNHSVLKYIGYKAAKVRWRPVDREKLQEPKVFATGSYDNKVNEVCLWEYNPFVNDDDPTMLLQPKKICSCNLNASVTDMVFTDEDVVVASCTSGSVLLYKYCSEEKGLKDIHQWNNLHIMESGICCSSTCVASSSFYNNVYTGGDDGKIFIIATERLCVTNVMGRESTSSLTALCSLQSQVLSANISGQLKLWDLRCTPVKPVTVITVSNNELVSTLCLDKHPNQSHSIIAGCDNGSVCFCDLRQGKHPVLLMSAHSSEVWETQFHPRFPSYLFTCSQDGSLWQWNRSSEVTAHIGATHNKVEVVNLLPSSISSINSFDIASNNLIASSDAEALFVLNDLSVY